MTPFVTFLVFLLSLSAAVPPGQPNGTIRGYVRDAESNEPIPAANVFIQGTVKGAATDGRGFYEIISVPPGEYRLEATVIGYKMQIRGVTVKDGETVRLDFGLVPTVIEMKEITVGPQSREPIPSITLQSEEITRLAPTTTADILKEIPGVSTSRPGGWGTKPYLQGMTDSRLLVLVDGARINQACPMGMDACTATLEPEMIDNVEVLKGPGAVEYGSGNMGGVITISTVSSDYGYSPAFQSEFRYAGSYKSVSNSRTGTLSFNGGNNRFDLIASVDRGVHGDYQTKRGTVENSGFESGNVHLKMRYHPSSDRQLALSTQIYRAKNIGWPAANTIIPTEKRSAFVLNYVARNTARHFRRIELHLSYQPMYHTMTNTLPGNRQYTGNSRSDTYNASAKTTWPAGDNHTLLFGADFTLWKMNARRVNVENGSRSPFIDILPHSSLGEFGIFVQDEFKISPRLKTEIGIRSNYVTSNAEKEEASIIPQNQLRSRESLFNGSAALLYKLGSDIVLTTSISRGFKVPTPVERYIAAPMLDGYYRIGTPTLFSETNTNARAGLRGMRNRLNWGMEVYTHRLSGLISAEVDSETASPYEGLKGVKRFVNINEATVHGGSIFVGFSIAQWLFLTTSVSYDWGEDRITGEPLPFMAPLQSSTKLRYHNSDKGQWLEISARAAAEQNRYSRSYGEKYTPGYVVFNVRGGWEISEGLELSVGVENVFNHYYRDHLNPASLPEPGRNGYIRVNLTVPDRAILTAGRHKKEDRLQKTEKITLLVEGMACQFCVNTVRERINALSGVVSTTVSLEEKTATVIIYQGRVSPDQLITAVDRAGFQASLISAEPLSP